MNARKYGKIAYDGLITNNATFKLVLGTCATLGMSTSAVNSFGMGLSVTVVLLLSNVIISLLRKVIPNTVRIPAFIVIIATMVTLLRMVLEKYIPDLYDSMGVFLPLIVVNCVILGARRSVREQKSRSGQRHRRRCHGARADLRPHGHRDHP